MNNHTNLGAIFRGAAALGMDAVLLSPSCADPLYRRSVRVSMGEVFAVPYARLDPWPGALDAVRAAGFTVIAMTPAADAVPLNDLGEAARQRPALLLRGRRRGLVPESAGGGRHASGYPDAPRSRLAERGGFIGGGVLGAVSVSSVFPSVRDVLALDPMKYGAPRVVAGGDQLDRPVRWVHVAEVPDIATLLRGGELVLTTGIGLPKDDDGLRAFIATLAEVKVAGLVVELGRRFESNVPRVMAAAASRHDLPLIELRKATPFVRITEAVHALIVDAQLAELRASEEIHQRFTELSVEGAEAAEVVTQAAALAGAPIVLENLSRQVLAYDTAGERPELRAGRLGVALTPDPGRRPDRVRRRRRLAGHHGRRPGPGLGSTAAALARGRVVGGRTRDAADAADDPARTRRLHARARPSDPA